MNSHESAFYDEVMCCQSTLLTGPLWGNPLANQLMVWSFDVFLFFSINKLLNKQSELMVTWNTMVVMQCYWNYMKWGPASDTKVFIFGALLLTVGHPYCSIQIGRIQSSNGFLLLDPGRGLLILSFLQPMPSLVQTMACRLAGDKPLSEPMLE